jgi:hypothetical protein
METENVWEYDLLVRTTLSAQIYVMKTPEAATDHQILHVLMDVSFFSVHCLFYYCELPSLVVSFEKQV